jgi:hypothetical protein
MKRTLSILKQQRLLTRPCTLIYSADRADQNVRQICDLNDHHDDWICFPLKIIYDELKKFKEVVYQLLFEFCFQQQKKLAQL